MFGRRVRVQPALAAGEDVGVEVDEARYCPVGFVWWGCLMAVGEEGCGCFAAALGIFLLVGEDVILGEFEVFLFRFVSFWGRTYYAAVAVHE